MYCTVCGRRCATVRVDVGVGTTEFWGARSNDSKLVLESACCGADVTEEPPEGDEDDE